MVHEEAVVLGNRRPDSGVANQPWVVSKVSKERSHLLDGESIARGVHLRKGCGDLERQEGSAWCSIASREKGCFVKILKNASKDFDIVVHPGTNDLSQKDVLSLQKDFQSFGQEMSKISYSFTFSEVLPVQK